MLRGTKNGVEFRANFLACFSLFFLNSPLQQNPTVRLETLQIPKQRQQQFIFWGQAMKPNKQEETPATVAAAFGKNAESFNFIVWNEYAFKDKQ